MSTKNIDEDKLIPIGSLLPGCHYLSIMDVSVDVESKEFSVLFKDLGGKGWFTERFPLPIAGEQTPVPVVTLVAALVEKGPIIIDVCEKFTAGPEEFSQYLRGMCLGVRTTLTDGLLLCQDGTGAVALVNSSRSAVRRFQTPEEAENWAKLSRLEVSKVRVMEYVLKYAKENEALLCDTGLTNV